jgi:hypothetical protein
MTLQRLVLDYRTGELVVRCLYRSSLDGPNPGTKARGKEVSKLVRSGLEGALEALEGDVTMCGTSGYTTREDVLLATTSSPTVTKAKLVKGA